MKICHVNNLLPTHHKLWAGGAQATYRFVKLLAKKGVKNIVLSTKPTKKPEKDNDFEFHAVTLAQDVLGEKLGRLLKRPFDPIAYFHCYKMLKKIKPDIVHLHNFGDLGFGVVLAAKRLKIPVVFSIYNYWCFCPNQTLMKNDDSVCNEFHGPQCIECMSGKKDPLQKIFMSKRKAMFDFFLFSRVDKFLALSNYLSKLLQAYGVKKSRIAVVRSPFNEIKLKKSRIEKNLILYAGMIVPRKGLDVIIRAMPKIVKEVPDARLYVLGQEDPCEIDYKTRVKELIKEYRLEKNILWFEKKPKSEFEKLIRKAAVMAIPEQWNNMSPLLVIECMMFGKGIVASNMGGIPELLQGSGLLAKASSPDDFAKKIVWALKNNKKMQAMGKKAREKAIKMFDEERIAKELIGTYSSLIKK